MLRADHPKRGLEVDMNEKMHPIVFIHGLWLHASSWQPWQDFFAQAGYSTVAPGWPGDADTVADTRAKADDEADHGIDDITNHYAAVIDALDTPPILIGHSFGGMVAEKLLGQGRGAAAVAIDAAQIKGVLVLPLAAARTGLPVLKNPRNKHRAITLTPKQFRYSFGNALTEEESDTLYDKWTIPGPGRPLFEAAFAAFSRHSPDQVDTANADRGPLLLIAGGEDHTVPEAVTKSSFKKYRDSGAVTDFMEFPDRGHSLTIDSRWHEVADASLTWLEKHGL
jgi:pimeloyl-ACP methyl ester carboxylesterase